MLKWRRLLFVVAIAALAPVSPVCAGVPDWLQAQLNAPVPAHDDETNAVALYSDTELTVLPNGKIRKFERRAYRILRRGGQTLGTVPAYFTPQNRITAMRGWSLPETGKPFEVKSRDIIETALTDVDGGELVTDLRRKVMTIPAAIPGNVIGYEIESELRPYEMTDEWYFQGTIPVREARYTVRLPAGWSYNVFWLNHPEITPKEVAPGQWQWLSTDMKPVKLEGQMPPWRGIAAHMVVSLQPPGGQSPQGQRGGFRSWQEMGAWYLDLTKGRRDPSPQVRQKVQELTAGAPDVLSKIRALAAFVQKDIRYVAIELGLGSYQPHPASDVFSNGYGDCKDKVTLLSSMLKEIGIESYYVIINTTRGSVTAATPPNLGFNHAVMAIQLPAGVDTSKLPAHSTHKTLGTLLFFDPTHPLIPLGFLPGALQANYGALVTPEGGELVALPQTPSELSGMQRTAKLTLDESGLLKGDVRETWTGEGAAFQRFELRAAQQDVDQIKSVESMLTHSLSQFRILKASVGNLSAMERPLNWNYSLEVERYGRKAGDLLILRPRVFGSLSNSLLETKEARQHPIEFSAPSRATDEFEITVPAGFVPDSLPERVDVDLGAIAYHSATTFSGQVLKYTRTLEVKELSMPASKADELKKFFRAIEGDERNSAVLKKAL